MPLLQSFSVSPLGPAGAGQAPTSRLWGLCRLGVVPLLGVDEASHRRDLTSKVKVRQGPQTDLHRRHPAAEEELASQEEK